MRVIEIKEKMVKQKVVIKDLALCDKCNKDINDSRDSMYDAYDCHIEIKTGVDYPEGGGGEKFTIDICQVCLEEFLLLLKKNGYRVNETEWDS